MEISVNVGSKYRPAQLEWDDVIIGRLAERDLVEPYRIVLWNRLQKPLDGSGMWSAPSGGSAEAARRKLHDVTQSNAAPIAQDPIVAQLSRGLAGHTLCRGKFKVLQKRCA